MDKKGWDMCEGFSLAKIMLSDVLPASLYYPGEDKGFVGGGNDAPVPDKLRPERGEDA